MHALLLMPLLLPPWLDPAFIIQALGNWALWGVAVIVFAECGMFLPLPGDSLLFTVGMFAALGTISFGSLSHPLVLITSCALLTVAAVGGNICGYWIGHVIGPPIFKERTGLAGKIFNPKYVDMTHRFFEKYGNRTLILARFVPVVRGVVTLVAGVAKMRFGSFIGYTAIGGVAWVFIVTTLGYFLGTVPLIHDNIDLALVIIVILSVIPMGVEYVLARRRNKAEAAQ